jgi:uncharacterized NAD-dependent epimerase/dehydratase family protein
VLCHEAGRETINGYESFDIPPLSEVVDLYDRLAAPVSDAEVVAGSLNTRHLGDPAAERAVTEYGEAIDAPACDPVRFGVADDVLDALL